MPTSSFDRKIEIKSSNAIRRFERAMNQKDAKINFVSAYTDEERRRSEELLKKLLSCSVEK